MRLVAEDLARLGHHLALLGRVVVAVLEGLDLRQDVERDLVRIDGGARPRRPRARPGPGRAAPRRRAGRCPRWTGRWRRSRARSRPRRGSASAPSPSASSSSSGWRRCPRGGRARRRSPRPRPAARWAPCARRSSCRRPRSPVAANRGAHSRDTPPPAENSAMSKPSIAPPPGGAPSSSPSRYRTVRPAERAEASGTTSRAAKPRSPITSSIVEPTAPVAPTTATRGSALGRAHRGPPSSRSTSSLPSSNASCSARTASRHAVGGDHAGDLDRRGGDHLDVDLLFAEGLEHLRRDAGMAAHAGADHRDLAHLLVGDHVLEAQLAGEPLERPPRGAQVRPRHGERDLGHPVRRTRARSGRSCRRSRPHRPACRRCAPRCRAGRERR